MARGKSGSAATETSGNSSGSQKLQAIKLAMEQIEKQYGKGSIMKLGDRKSVKVDIIPTGSIALDLALGVGGLPRGRIVEIYGPEASGKTTLALHVVAEAQKRGGQAAFIDAEHALDPARAEPIGVNLDDLLMSQALHKLTGAISKSKTILIFTNQLRQKIGVIFGNPETTPGGLALKS